MTFGIPKKTLRLWQLRFTAVFAAIDAVLLVLSGSYGYVIFPLLFFALLQLLFLLLLLPRFFADFKITLSCGAVAVSCGVFIKSVRVMPFARLIYAESFSSPASRTLGLCAVSLRAARGLLIIPEISLSNAAILLDYIENGDECNENNH